MKIALALLPEYSPDFPCIGLAYVAAALRRAGHDVTVFDFNIDIYRSLPPEQREHLWSNHCVDYWWHRRLSYIREIWPAIKVKVQAQVEQLVAGEFDAVAFSLVLTNAYATMWMAHELRRRQPNVKIVAGGPSVYVAHHVCPSVIDVLVCGEGEGTIVEVMDRVARGDCLRTIQGTVGNSPRPPLDMSELPIPDYGDFESPLYRSRLAPVQFSRGCPFQCAFCNDRQRWPGFRTRKPRAVLDELELHHRRGATDFYVVDSLINADVSWLEEVANLMIERKLDITLRADVRVNPKMTSSLFVLLQRAGFTAAAFGVESGSRKVLRLMNKGIDPDVAEQNMRDCSQSGIVTMANIVVGFPGETEAEFEATWKWIRRTWSSLDRINLSSFFRIPGFEDPGALAVPEAVSEARRMRLQPLADVLAAECIERETIEAQLAGMHGRIETRRVARSLARQHRPTFDAIWSHSHQLGASSFSQPIARSPT